MKEENYTQFEVVVEKTSAGYSAYYIPCDDVMVTTTGKDLVELFKNLSDATDLNFDAVEQSSITERIILCFTTDLGMVSA